MFKKIMIGACVIGGIVMGIIMCALMLGVHYLDLFEFTIIQIFYILGLIVMLVVHAIYTYIQSKRLETKHSIVAMG